MSLREPYENRTRIGNTTYSILRLHGLERQGPRTLGLSIEYDDGETFYAGEYLDRADVDMLRDYLNEHFPPTL